MEFNVSNEEINRAVTTANHFVANKTTMPILECLMLTVSDGEVRLTATDTEMGAEIFLDTEKVKEDGNICVDAKLFQSIVGKMPTGNVTLKTGENVLNIKCGKAKFKIPTRDGSEFPSLENVARDNFITLTQGELKDLIRQTIFSTSLNDAQRMMTGVCFDISDNLKVTALDGHRIAIREVDMKHEPMKAIIPAKALTEIMKMPYEGDVNIYFTDSQAMFSYATANVAVRLIDGTYYDTSKIISNESKTTLKTDRKALIECLDRTTLLIKEIERKPVIMTIGDGLNIEIVTQLGSMNEDIEVEIDGERDWKIGINPRFMLDALKAIDDDTATIYFNGAKQPCQIKGDGYCYVVLPINIGA